MLSSVQRVKTNGGQVRLSGVFGRRRRLGLADGWHVYGKLRPEY